MKLPCATAGTFQNGNGKHSSWKLLVIFLLTLLCVCLFTIDRSGLHDNMVYNFFKPFEPGLDQYSKDQLILMLDTLAKLLEAHNLTYFMYGGTLLGAYRHRGLIPWDDDLDIILDERQKEDALRVLKKLEPTYLHTVYVHDKVYKSDTKNKQVFFTRTWPYVDIFFYQQNGTHMFAEEVFFWRNEVVFPLKRRGFEYLTLPVPNDVEAFMDGFRWGNTLEMCRSATFDHYRELPIPSVTVPCLSMHDRYPFIHRTKTSGGTLEKLKVGERVIHSELISD